MPTDLKKYRAAKRQKTAKKKTLCASGFHSWTDYSKKQFDVRQGRLISIRECKICGKKQTLSS
jgi:hypothetical protein